MKRRAYIPVPECVSIISKAFGLTSGGLSRLQLFLELPLLRAPLQAQVECRIELDGSLKMFFSKLVHPEVL